MKVNSRSELEFILIPPCKNSSIQASHQDSFSLSADNHWNVLVSVLFHVV